MRSILRTTAALVAGITLSSLAAAQLPTLDVRVTTDDSATPVVVTIAMEVTGAPGGLATVFGSSGTSAPIATVFGDVLIDPTSLFVIGTVPLDATGFGAVSVTFPEGSADFTVAAQAAVLDPAVGWQLTSNVTVGYGAAITLCWGVGYYNDAANFYFMTLFGLPFTPVEVCFYSASTLTTTTIQSTNILLSGTTVVAGIIDLQPGDMLTIKCGSWTKVLYC